jgi:hypothetical protein
MFRRTTTKFEFSVSLDIQTGYHENRTRKVYRLSNLSLNSTYLLFKKKGKIFVAISSVIFVFLISLFSNIAGLLIPPTHARRPSACPTQLGLLLNGEEETSMSVKMMVE